MAYFENLFTGEKVPEEDAYKYAMEKCQKDAALKKEYEDATVFWYFSGDWVKGD